MLEYLSYTIAVAHAVTLAAAKLMYGATVIYCRARNYLYDSK